MYYFHCLQIFFLSIFLICQNQFDRGTPQSLYSIGFCKKKRFLNKIFLYNMLFYN